MQENRKSYHIIDEPRVRALEYLIVNPLVILLVSIFLPLFWNPPFFGRFWMPFVWVLFNSYLLGSPGFWKELLISVAGLLMMLGVFYVGLILIGIFIPANMEVGFPYIMILLMATFFTFLYLVVFIQMVPWSIYDYIRENKH